MRTTLHLVALAALLFFLALPSKARAQCSFVTQGIKVKIRQYAAYREKNEQMIRQLLSAETGCRDKGAEISGRVAKLAAAESCKAEMDASGMDKQLVKVGAECEALFKKIHGLQMSFRDHYNEVEADLSGGLAFMETSPYLRRDCTAEIGQARVLVKNFIDLERKIIAVEERSLDGKTNYGKFKVTADALRALTQDRGESCEGIASSVTKVIASAKGDGGALVPTGRSPRKGSDITGVRDKSQIPELK